MGKRKAKRAPAEKPPEDPVMAKVRELIAARKWTQQELGERMGYPALSARKSVSQILSKSHDPRISVLRRFAQALEMRLIDLFAEDGGRGEQP